MATSSATNFVGPLYAAITPPTASTVGKPLETGMVYVDTDLSNGSNLTLGVYNAVTSTWSYVLLSSSAATTTSTTTTQSTSTTTSTTTTA